MTLLVVKCLSCMFPTCWCSSVCALKFNVDVFYSGLRSLVSARYDLDHRPPPGASTGHSSWLGDH